ncbi:DUF6484 domain-containing protein [Roseateles depolymerans]|uniref:Uncharacterized protein n=1 Tax=Roseateles depolymerans TaxID=76731 RepID=A0A0U2TYW7_9BURK|nr:DUF6484 domain-containing protein [Roseateles depolymerans]ALV05361.1 hypothetical protein RD2015_865 [Roseateles depolymerans]REG14623.1 hypothetical protein DES44_3119 [Roseateles depolymerans]
MKHRVSEYDPASVLLPEEDPGLLQQMLERPVTPSPARVDGIAIGELAGQTADGDTLVRVLLLGAEPLVARVATVVDVKRVGQAVAVAFEGGDPKKPIILGVMQSSGIPPQPVTQPWRAMEASVDGQRRVVIQADQEIELRCGEAAILMTADGRIHLRGQNITSEADMSQRILGASVSVN